MKKRERRRPRKLVLARETVRRLSAEELTGVVGGTGNWVITSEECEEAVDTCGGDCTAGQSRTIGCG